MQGLSGQQIAGAGAGAARVAEWQDCGPNIVETPAGSTLTAAAAIPVGAAEGTAERKKGGKGRRRGRGTRAGRRGRVGGDGSSLAASFLRWLMLRSGFWGASDRTLRGPEGSETVGGSEASGAPLEGGGSPPLNGRRRMPNGFSGSLVSMFLPTCGSNLAPFVMEDYVSSGTTAALVVGLMAGTAVLTYRLLSRGRGQ